MATVLGLHKIELRPGASEEEFERFFREEVAGVPLWPGWRMKLLKSDKGSRAGEYALLFVIDSVEARDRILPPGGGISIEGEQFAERHKSTWEPASQKWLAFCTTPIGGDPDFMDFVTIVD